MVFTKQGNSGKRKQPELPENVAKKCASGKVNEANRRNIKELVDAFRKKYKASNVELNGTAISFLENIELSENIIAVFREVKAIPQNAKILDFPEKNTISSKGCFYEAIF